MKKKKIPVYDICNIDHSIVSRDLLMERFGSYLQKHYTDLHRPHRHSFFHLVLFTEGSGTHTIDFKTYKVKPYRIYFMSPGQVHSWNFTGKTEGYIVHFSDDFFKPFLYDANYLEKFSFFSGFGEEHVRQLTGKEQHTVADLFEKLVDETGAVHPFSTDLIRSLLLQIFMLTERSTVHKKSKATPPQKTVLLRNFRQLIEKNFRSAKLPKEYADLLYVTPNHLNGLTMDLLGKTAGNLIRERILLEAKRLLTNADMSIAEIAYDLNFPDNSYFNRMFKKHEGITPDEFRKKFITQTNKNNNHESE